MSLNITQSHQIETLFQVLALQLQQPSSTIFDLRHIVIPNLAVKQWLIQRIAQQFGICSQIYWHQNVNELQWFLYQAVEQDKDKVRRANLPRVVMKWQIYQYLLTMVQSAQMDLTSEQHVFEPIIQRIYDYSQTIIDEQQARLKRQQMAYWLSHQITHVFQQYMRYRPTWVQLWTHNQPLNIEPLLQQDSDIPAEYMQQQLNKAQKLASWQQALWFSLFAEHHTTIEQIKQQFFYTANLTEQLPSTIYIFTLLDLAPSEWQFLQQLAQHTQVEVYHLTVTQEYWADSVDPRWKAQHDLKLKQRLQAKYQKNIADDIGAYQFNVEQGFDAQLREDRHPILTRFGKQARDNFSLLVELSGGESGGEWTDLFGQYSDDGEILNEEPEFASTLLGQLQQDIFYLMRPEPQSYVLSPDDTSIQIHACHSTLRQLEILKEQLMLWLAQHTPQQPRYLHDILVLVPNIQDVEPLIRSVFVGKDSPPISISGIVPLPIRTVWQSLIFPMIWSRGRFTLDDLIDWLNLSATKRYYQLKDEQIERIAQLLQSAGFRRGFDAIHLRQTLEQNDHDYRYSFKYALDRLAMGVAVDRENICPVTLEQWQNPYIMSSADVHLTDAELIGILLEIYQRFAERRDYLERYDVLAERWLAILLDDIQQLQQKGVEYTQQLYQVVKQYDRMLSLTYNYEQMEQESFSLKNLYLPLWDILQEIQQKLESLQEDIQFTGKICFGQIGKVRLLPYQLIVLLNMDSGVFPNREYPQVFDLLHYVRNQLGDRSRLEDHQGAFLDAILHAQQQVWFFYTAFDVENSELLEPSTVLLEFVQYLEQVIQQPNYEQHDETDSFLTKELGVSTALEPIYYRHSAQPFIPASYSKYAAKRPFSHWYALAQILNHGVQSQNFNVFQSVSMEMWDLLLSQKLYETPRQWLELIQRYQLDTQQVIQLNSRHWAKELRHPAQLFLKHFNISNQQGDEHLHAFEPLILNSLEKYQVLDRIMQQHDEQAIQFDSTQIDLHLEPLLPVGKLKYSYWQDTVNIYQQMQQILHKLDLTETPTLQKIWQFAPQLQFTCTLPQDLSTTIWARILPNSLSASQRLAVWIDYLLWLAYLDADETSRDYHMVCVFKNGVLTQSGLSSDEAKQQLLAWLDLYFAGQRMPIILPAGLLLDKDIKKEQDWQDGTLNPQVYESLDKKRNNSFHHNTYIKEHEAEHPDWQLVLQGFTQSQALFYRCLEQYSHLYYPIWQHQILS